MLRSKKVIFLAHCILNQNCMPRNLESISSFDISLLQLLRKFDLGVEQMPCPEIGFYEVDRDFKEEHHEDFIRICRNYAEYVGGLIGKYIRSGYKVVGVVGVAGCSCAVHRIMKGGELVEGEGLFIKSLKEELKRRGIKVDFFEIDFDSWEKSLEELEKCLKRLVKP